jgi:hypothetical protein
MSGQRLASKVGTVTEIANAIGTASVLAFVFGAIMTIDCRGWAKTWEQAQSCYFTGGSVMGLGGMGKAASGMFLAGYGTYNPALHKNEKPQSDRPESI